MPQVYRVARLVGWLASASTSAVRWRPEEDFGSVKTGSRLQKEVTEGHERMCRVTVGMSRRKGGSARAAERAEEETSLALSSRVSSSRSEQSGKEDPTAERKDNEKGQDGLGCSPLVALENVHPTYARRASWELVRPCTPLCSLRCPVAHHCLANESVLLSSRDIPQSPVSVVGAGTRRRLLRG